jgi:hypothetical protein
MRKTERQTAIGNVTADGPHQSTRGRCPTGRRTDEAVITPTTHPAIGIAERKTENLDGRPQRGMSHSELTELALRFPVLRNLQVLSGVLRNRVAAPVPRATSVATKVTHNGRFSCNLFT